MYKQIYNKILSRPIIAIGIIQFIFILLVFNKIIFHPNDYMFANGYDGLKNYFTFFQFITQEPSALGPWHFTKMNYPFGEYVFFTDNTPGLSMPLRFINQHLFNISGNLIGIHNYFFLFNLLLTPILFYKLIKPYSRELVWMAIFFSLAIAWINPQLLKLLYGVYNLSLSSILLICLLLLRRIALLWSNYSSKELYRICISLFALIFASAFFHIYYIPMIAMVVGIFTLSLFVLDFIKNKSVKVVPLMLLGVSTALGGLSYFFLIQFVDQYKNLRQATASGFSWVEWNFTPDALITPLDYNSIWPIIKSCKTSLEIPSESHGFLGNFVWFTLFISFGILIYFLVKKELSFKQIFQKLTKHHFLVALLIAMFFTYATASGLYVKVCTIPLSFDNVFSPFYFLYDKIDLITQFRCLGRFSWLGYWIMFFLTLITFFKFYRFLYKKKAIYARIYAFVLLFFMYWDAKDAMLYQSRIHKTNIFKEEILQDKFEGLEAIDFSAFQALYTIPAVQVGSENYNITIDDQEGWTDYWMQLSVYSGLPLFNCKMSRTAVEQAQAQIDLLLYKKVPSLILDKVNDKPILLVYSKEKEDNFNIGVLDYARPAAENGSEIITAFNMDTILVLNNIYYLSWDIKNNN